MKPKRTRIKATTNLKEFIKANKPKEPTSYSIWMDKIIKATQTPGTKENTSWRKMAANLKKVNPR
jgi:hypothetical protein